MTSPPPREDGDGSLTREASLSAAFPRVSLLHLGREALLPLIIQHLLPGTHPLLPYPELEPQPTRHRQRAEVIGTESLELPALTSP